MNDPEIGKEITDQKTTKLEDTGERMVPEFHRGSLLYAEHITRYQAAQKIVKDRDVLDIACGTGYGTNLLAQTAKKIFGVDISDDAIAYAKEHYAAVNIDFRVGDGIKIPLDNASVDVVVTFETIEHIQDYHAFLSEIKRVLRPDGLVIISTPNDLEFAEGNHFHLHEFEYEELLSSIKTHFQSTEPYFQTTWRAVAVGRDIAMGKDGPIRAQVINLAPVSSEQYLYFYILCSNREITENVDTLVALGSHYSDRQILAIDIERNHRLDQLNDEVLRLSTINISLQNRFNNVQTELAIILRSRAYRLARILSRAKNRFVGPS